MYVVSCGIKRKETLQEYSLDLPVPLCVELGVLVPSIADNAALRQDPSPTGTCYLTHKTELTSLDW